MSSSDEGLRIKIAARRGNRDIGSFVQQSPWEGKKGGLGLKEIGERKQWGRDYG